MNQTAFPARTPPDDQFDALQAVRIVIRRWPLVLVVTCLAVLIATLIAFLVPPTFKADVVLLVSTDEDSSKLQGLSAIASQFGLSGGGVGDNGSNKKAEAVATLQSEILTERYITENGLMPILFASKWDSVRKEWKSKDPQKQPTLWDGNELFRKRIRSVAEDRRTGTITMTIMWKDGELAAKWANGLVAMTNSYLRQKSIDRSARNLAYLNEQSKETKTVELQEAINKLIESEIKKTMLARGNEEYAFGVIDPAVVPPYRPLKRRLIIIVSGVVVGLFGGVLACFLSDWFGNSRRSVTS